jgi:hypothetical protein
MFRHPRIRIKGGNGHEESSAEVFFWLTIIALKASSGKVRYHKKTSTGRKYVVVNEGYF